MLPGASAGGDCGNGPGAFRALPGFLKDDLVEAYACFHASAVTLVAGGPELRPALPASTGLLDACRAAVGHGPVATQADALAFFEANFEPVRVDESGRDAFFTGYYEPVLDGSAVPRGGFEAPLLGRPDDLKTFAAEESRPPWLTGFSAARIGGAGALSVYPSRTEIEASAMQGCFRPVVWLRDWVEAFLVHVQGSARVRLPDGVELRVTYAGRNGHPYTSIGKILVQEGHIEADAMSLDRLKSWLRQGGQEPGMPGRAVMQRNASFIFFEAAPATSDGGPVGGMGLPLTPLRSVAVDRLVWSYGLPFWVDAELPWQSAVPTSFRRLMIAQDTGSAITGPARADLYFGSGDPAGRLAGGIRHRGGFTLLRPKRSTGAGP